MSISSQDFIKSILLKPENSDMKMIGESLVPLLVESESRLSEKLSVMLMIFMGSKGQLNERIESIKSQFNKVLSIVNENCLKLPEEENQIKSCMKKISEEGEGASEAPTNVTAGIEASTPRINPGRIKKKKAPETTPK